MQLHTYLNFNGDCEAAFNFYARCLGGKIEFKMTHKESPMAQQTPPDWQDKIMHMRINIDGQVLMGSDSPPGCHEKPAGFQVSINLTDAAQAERIFTALQEGGTVRMPLQETFWALRFGMLTDRYGTPWMVNCEAAPQ
ncbi:VOC family protein [Herbaspirillum autotrophicum]|uniref:VOC family protein n=1 Tax=Herbaspirillum autotrophicum TaxID=180195 RepID=UPI00067C607A|nr:VOC family protein [Herbaspirillum autotrophicum]